MKKRVMKMFRIAIVETESIAKDYVFIIGQLLHNYAWNFIHLTSVMEFFKEQQNTSFDIVIFNEKFDTSRIYESLIKDKPYTVIFSCEQLKEKRASNQIFYINRHQIDKDILTRIMLPVVKQQEDFFFSYHNIKIMMKINDIQYIEKQDKYLIYHTTKGEFKERGNMSDAITRFEPYHFLHIHLSYLVNETFVKELQGDVIILKDQTYLPIARSKAVKIKQYLKRKKL